jgi:hypothetical protein
MEELPLQNVVKQTDALPLILPNSVLNKTTRKCKTIRGGTIFSRLLQHLSYAHDVVIRQIPRCHKASIYITNATHKLILAVHQHNQIYGCNQSRKEMGEHKRFMATNLGGSES